MSRMRETRRSRVTALLVATFAVAAVFAVPALADGQITYEQCHRDVRSGTSLASCQPLPLPPGSDVLLPRPPDVFRSGPNDAQLRCEFLFWGYDGKAHLEAELPVTVQVPEEGSRTAVAWYHCRCLTCDDPSSGVPLSAIDLATGDLVTEPFVEAVDPSSAAGDCPTSSPCVIDSGASSVTARETVGIRRFVYWQDKDAGRLRPSPSGLLIALYRSDPCLNTDLSRLPVTCGLIPDLRPPGDHRVDLEILDRPAWSPLDRICHFVYGVEGCPGCGGPDRLCPGVDLILEGAAGLVDGMIVDRKSGEVVAKARPVGKGDLSLRFQPETRGTIDGGRYALLLVPREGELEKAGGRASVRPRITYTCGR